MIEITLTGGNADVLEGPPMLDESAPDTPIASKVLVIRDPNGITVVVPFRQPDADVIAQKLRASAVQAYGADALAQLRSSVPAPAASK